jgi:hypothetical protein
MKFAGHRPGDALAYAVMGTTGIRHRSRWAKADDDSLVEDAITGGSEVVIPFIAAWPRSALDSTNESARVPASLPGAGSVRSRYTRGSTSAAVSCRVYRAQACIQPSSRGSEHVARSPHPATRRESEPGTSASWGSLESQELQLGKRDPESSGLRRRSQG